MSSPMAFMKLVSDPSKSYQANIIACAIITWAIGAIFVALRFYTRGCLLHNVLGAEDWLILVALIFSGATCAGMIEQAVYGLGKHALDINLNVLMPMARAGWYTILWYMLSLLFTKISILLLYLRILRYQHARYAIYAIMAIVIIANGLWTLGTVVTACTPLSAFWQPGLHTAAHCHPTSYWYANTALHIGTDILLYILPLPVIINLQARPRQKIGLYCILALGFGVCTISSIRLWDLVLQPTRADFTFDNASISYLTTLEINAAIACACCMTLKPLVLKFFPSRRSMLWGGGSPVTAAAARDVERAAVIEVKDGRGPPTIGSWPTRGVLGHRRSGGSGDEELLGEDGGYWDRDGSEPVTVEEGKRSTETVTERGSLGEEADGIGVKRSSSVPRRPPQAHIAQKGSEP